MARRAGTWACPCQSLDPMAKLWPPTSLPLIRPLTRTCAGEWGWLGGPGKGLLEAHLQDTKEAAAFLSPAVPQR